MSIDKKITKPLINTIDPEECPWDQARLKIIAKSPAEEQRMLDISLRQGEQGLVGMETCCENNDLVQWRRVAHTLYGMALNLGMQRLASYCKEEEESTSSREACIHLMEGIRAELKHIKQYKER